MRYWMTQEHRGKIVISRREATRNLQGDLSSLTFVEMTEKLKFLSGEVAAVADESGASDVRR